MAISKKLSVATELEEHEFLSIVRNGKVLTINGDGISVVRTRKGRYVKLFRQPSMLSSDIYSPRPLRFVTAVNKLNELEIPTVRDVKLYSIPCMKRYAVHYKKLKGKELRGLLKESTQIEPLVSKWIELVAYLHEKGVYFRGINFSNVLLCPDNKLGLIDVGSAEFKPDQLSASLRARNLKHPLAYEEDKKILESYGIDRLISEYLDAAGLSSTETANFLAKLKSQHRLFENLTFADNKAAR